MTDLTPYEVLGIEPCATLKEIKAAYRILSKEYHPDKGGDAEKFQRLQNAYDVLSNPERRARYDQTGRTDESAATPEKVKAYLRQTMNIVIEATRNDGTTDDPCWENILGKMLMSLVAGRVPLNSNITSAKRKLDRTNQLIKRFKLKSGQDFDPVGDALREEKKRLEQELRGYDDAMELSLAVEKTLKEYQYEVGPDPEGQPRPGPATHRLLGGGATVIFR